MFSNDYTIIFRDTYGCGNQCMQYQITSTPTEYIQLNLNTHVEGHVSESLWERLNFNTHLEQLNFS